MTGVFFDLKKLNKRDQEIYSSMSDSEKKQFENLWETMETKKQKLMQLQVASRDRVQREKKALSEKERKARNHRLIERGAILESFIDDSAEFSGDEIKDILSRALKETAIEEYIFELKSNHLIQNNSKESLPETGDDLSQY